MGLMALWVHGFDGTMGYMGLMALWVHGFDGTMGTWV